MAEYWINVYITPNGCLEYGSPWSKRGSTEIAAQVYLTRGLKTIYRIHVVFK